MSNISPGAASAAVTGGLPNDVHEDANTDSWTLVARRLLSECFGTLPLVVVDCGGAVIGSLDGEVTAVARKTTSR